MAARLKLTLAIALVALLSPWLSMAGAQALDDVAFGSRTAGL